MYQPIRASRSEYVPIRNLRYHVRVWGEPSPGQVPLVMVHGWMDVSASWQFVVDALARDRYVIAPDWRGYGQTTADPVDNYWFADYLADLDFLLDHYAKDQPVDLVGHSMGGNVAMMYAGVQPARIRRLVNLEGFGSPRSRADEAPGRYAKWMAELKQFHRGEMGLAPYDSADGVARRLMKTNRRLAQDKADWLARHWAQATTRADGTTEWRIQGDPAHKIVFAQAMRVDEVLALYGAITAPVLAVEASDDSLAGWWKGRYSLDEYHERLESIAQCTVARVEDAGHMLQHDQPLAVAQLLEKFFH
ncbi:alpha/beta fold hydrolase [Pseudorhodoferax sp. Leaf267]|uniref:alpha/beta fold hydrolase n=1 Tax=Pseudorhodoferax sp. Leaf267 TaxID=1736316 RepID=UPI0006F6868B|nr:alpha/beta hydrolase [Pseudorhodoferax sp. Leaf267]KQP18059.1 alpha/beta hydrolase [Pseudorhodoferax sp. Leaf267]